MTIVNKINSEINEYFISPKHKEDNTIREMFMNISFFLFFLLLIFKF